MSPDPGLPRTTRADLRLLEDLPTAPQTRRGLIRNTLLGAAAVGTLGPVGSALASPSRSAIVGAEDPMKVSGVAITAEALANVFTAEAIRRAPGKPAQKFLPVMRALGASEFDHYRDLAMNTPAKPLTLKFWIPESAFGKMASDFFNVVQMIDTLFINAYLIGITSFATAATKTKSPKMRDFLLLYSRVSGEILGVEAEHRVLARFAASQTGGAKPGGVANNKGFETFSITTIDGIVKAMEALGIGFGKESAKPGKFYTFDGKKPPEFSSILANFKA